MEIMVIMHAYNTKKWDAYLPLSRRKKNIVRSHPGAKELCNNATAMSRHEIKDSHAL